MTNYYQQEIARGVALLERAVVTRETRVIARVVRAIGPLRRRWNGRQYAMDRQRQRQRETVEGAEVELLPEDVEAERAEAAKRAAAAKSRAQTLLDGSGTTAAGGAQKEGKVDDSEHQEAAKGNEAVVEPLRPAVPPAGPVEACRQAHQALAWALRTIKLTGLEVPAPLLLEHLDAALDSAVSHTMEVVRTSQGGAEADGEVATANGAPPSEEESPREPAAAAAPTLPSSSSVPEVAAYLHLLTLFFVIDARLPDGGQRATACADRLVDALEACPRRHTMDELVARAYYALTLAYEMGGKLTEARPRLYAAHRTAVMRHDHVGQAVLLNQLLRSYLLERQYVQADQLCSRAHFPEIRSNNQLARYFYYLGRIKTVQLDYTEAYRALSQAQRKAPQHTALGLRVAIAKLLVLVQLLVGEVPELSVFRGRVGMSDSAALRAQLQPYLRLTSAVRVGDLPAFHAVVHESEAVFGQDGNLNLILRLRQNVIKAGLVKIAAAYSRIALADVQRKLGLDASDDGSSGSGSSSSAEDVVAKAIRDGVLRGTIEHRSRSLITRHDQNVYATAMPAAQLHERIQFCVDLHDEAVRAMRFPDAKRNEANLELLREMQRDETKIEQALAEGAEPEDDDDDDQIL
ncbi:hypothetical protein CDCA_CDCA03G0945 [Cyanidium caldarium]|uniref:PCI domain-containing protein n=1 Tax=Cyanidium caldarium TaxID=2771 RepID=A0AAV9IRJ0_CYACA|nr:hypothetical protein CDCA_CDCA03G0945 [Cyanidium caldarium]